MARGVCGAEVPWDLFSPVARMTLEMSEIKAEDPSTGLMLPVIGGKTNEEIRDLYQMYEVAGPLGVLGTLGLLSEDQTVQLGVGIVW